MLKLGHLPDVNQIAFTRDTVLGKLQAVQRGDFVVSIGNAAEREGAEVKRLVQPVLERHLNDRIGQLNRALASYDVDVLD